MLTNFSFKNCSGIEVARIEVVRKLALIIMCSILVTICGTINSANAGNFSAAEQSQFIKDPTKPPITHSKSIPGQVVEAPKYVLTAIFNRAAQRYAVVNGSVVKKGDRLANMQVIDINETNVIMREKNSSKKDVVLELKSSVSIKKQVSQ